MSQLQVLSKVHRHGPCVLSYVHRSVDKYNPSLALRTPVRSLSIQRVQLIQVAAHHGVLPQGEPAGSHFLTPTSGHTALSISLANSHKCRVQGIITS